METRGQQLAGWLRVDTEDVATDAVLGAWVERGYAFAVALPPK